MLSASDVTIGGLASIPVLIIIALIADKIVQGQSKAALASTDESSTEAVTNVKKTKLKPEQGKQIANEQPKQ